MGDLTDHTSSSNNSDAGVSEEQIAKYRVAWARADTLYDNGYRVEAYLELYKVTGTEQFLTQAQITSYSGAWGGAAITGNAYAKQVDAGDGGVDYHFTLDKFSKGILKATTNKFKTLIDDGDFDGMLENDAFQEADRAFWGDVGMKDYFPGNSQFTDVWNHTDILDAPDAASSFGAVVIAPKTAMGMSLGKRPGEYVGDDRYEIHDEPNDRIITVTNKETRKIEVIYDKESALNQAMIGDPYSVPSDGLLETRERLSQYTQADRPENEAFIEGQTMPEDLYFEIGRDSYEAIIATGKGRQLIQEVLDDPTINLSEENRAAIEQEINLSILLDSHTLDEVIESLQTENNLNVDLSGLTDQEKRDYAQTLLDNENCFSADTPILLADGTTKSIKAIQVGDIVQSYDQHGSLVAGEVARLYRNSTNEWIELKHVELNEVVYVTPGHQFLAPSGQFFTIEHLLKVGQGTAEIILTDGAVARVKSRRITFNRQTTRYFELELAMDALTTANAGTLAVEIKPSGWRSYNFEVANHHTYIAGGIRVHNRSSTVISTSDNEEGLFEEFLEGIGVKPSEATSITLIENQDTGNQDEPA